HESAAPRLAVGRAEGRLSAGLPDGDLHQGAAAGRPAVVLLSGGLDSATCLAWARDRGFACHTLAVDYGQRHRVELDAARRVAQAQGVRDHRVVSVDLRAIGGSSPTADLAGPNGRDEAILAQAIPSPYVP